MAYTLTAPTLLARYDYGPYGKRATLYLSPTYTSGCDLGFTGHITQPNPLATQPNQPNQPDPTELLLTPFRPYDPDSAKWLSPDPIGEAGGMNLYGYVLGNPVNMWDPLGLEVGDWWDFSANRRRAHEIEKEELKKHRGRNDCSDAKRHADWSRRTAKELGGLYANLFGFAHELQNLLEGDHGLNEAQMDLHNNAEGRKAAKQNRQIDPKKLKTIKDCSKSYGNY